MTASTAGIEIKIGSQKFKSAVELLSSMRFAIALLSVISISSVVGTVIQQHEPLANYVNQFGPFWAELFARLHLYSVYSAWWFTLIMAFLVLSTTLCVIRTSPKILTDIRQYKENIREQSLKAFPHKAQAQWIESAEAAAHRIGQSLLADGWKVRLQQRETPQGPGWMVAAKAGAANKLGYIATHVSIVLICVGALLDGNMMVRAQMWLFDKTPFAGSGLISAVPEEHRLSDRNPTFRGNMLVTEGARTGTAILLQPTGVVLQELPFDIELKEFIVEYHANGQPSLFASDIIIHDHYTGEARVARVEVNNPVEHRGIVIYQSSFDDGGSSLQLRGIPLGSSAPAFDVQGRIGDSTPLTNGNQQLQLEFAELRIINVENFAQTDPESVPVGLRHAIEGRLGSGDRTMTPQELRNVGPSVVYRLRDAAGQAREFHNYMLPMELDGVRVFVMGVRETQADDFRYLRVPADENDTMDAFWRLKAALADEAMRKEAVRRYVQASAGGQRPDLQEALAASSSRVIELFAGADPEFSVMPLDGMTRLGGLQAISAFMESNVPEAEREKASEILLRILNGTLFELYVLSREKAGVPPPARDERTAAFMTKSVMSLSDAFFYPAPVTFMLTNFEHVQASVFQLTRSPGKNLVYFGCLLLTIGIFAMLYVRERRLWVWLSPQGEHVNAMMALSSNRKLMDNDHEFESLKNRLLKNPTEAQVT